MIVLVILLPGVIVLYLIMAVVLMMPDERTGYLGMPPSEALIWPIVFLTDSARERIVRRSDELGHALDNLMSARRQIAAAKESKTKEDRNWHLDAAFSCIQGASDWIKTKDARRS